MFGPSELLVIVIVGLILFGGRLFQRRMRDLGRSLHETGKLLNLGDDRDRDKT